VNASASATLPFGGLSDMAAFPHLDWTRFDVWSILAGSGIGCVEPIQREKCCAWLAEKGYVRSTIDFSGGIGPAVLELGRLFHWEDQFGYTLSTESGNLDALRDGFAFEFAGNEGRVLEFLNAEVAYRENPRWLTGLLSIGSEYTVNELALGHRFFAVLVLARNSPLVGVAFKSTTVPAPFRTTSQTKSPFDK
jgi:hypothetical protein